MPLQNFASFLSMFYINLILRNSKFDGEQVRV
jgi:hypothetical protein